MDRLAHQETTSVSADSIPPLSFLGQIGHSEYSLKISQSVRKRQTGLQENLDSKQNTSSLSEARVTYDISVGNRCDRCRPSRISLYGDGSLDADWSASLIPECVLEVTCDVALSNTTKTELLGTSFRRVLSFIKLPFRNGSWFYGSVRFPVWENTYSDILIGFSTSSVSAAAA